MIGILGKKLGMTQIFAEDERLIPVTVIEAGPCVVTQIKTTDTDGYNAIQIGFGDIKENALTNPLKGHFAKHGVAPRKHVSELHVDDPGQYSLGQELRADIFNEGDRTDVSGVSKGKGFSGGMKRWGFKGGPAGHGSHFHRRTGSIGMAATPARVIKGKKGPGQHGSVNRLISNLRVVRVDVEKNLILLRGAVPGARGSMVLIKATKKVAGKK